ncbi:MAG: preprotein translocase subunit SecG [Burkholderiaceae bacterium]
MHWLTSLMIVIQVLSSVAVIILVLLQHGKGADMGAAFGGGASGSLFGATGSANFLSRATAIAATFFFVATIGLTVSTSRAPVAQAPKGGVLGTVEQGGITNNPNQPVEAPKSNEIPK